MHIYLALFVIDIRHWRQKLTYNMNLYGESGEHSNFCWIPLRDKYIILKTLTGILRQDLTATHRMLNNHCPPRGLSYVPNIPSDYSSPEALKVFKELRILSFLEVRKSQED